MKKVLFATTALVATAGFASAQGIELSGSAEMGYAGGQGAEGFLSSVDVRFSMSGETDNGLTFGATVDLEDAAQQNTTTEVVDASADFTVFIGGAFGNLTLGDTDGAMDWAITEAVGSAGSLNSDETQHGGYYEPGLDGTQNGQVLRYDNTFGDFGVAVSAENEDEENLAPGVAVGLRYNVAFAGGSVALGGAYATSEAPAAGDTIGGTAIAAETNIDSWGLSAALTLDSGFTAGIAYTDIETNAGQDFEHYQISAGYAFGPFALGVNYGDWSGNATQSGYGITGSYDLGGGASLHAGYASTDNATGNDPDRYSFGLAMSF